MADLAESLPPPTPLRQGLLFHFQWGETKFEMVACAASIRTAFWDQTGEDVTWLHCKAIQVQAMTADMHGALTNFLIPADYITRAEPGPTFRTVRPKDCRELGIYPPTQPPPPNPIPLDELERVIVDLLDVSIN